MVKKIVLSVLLAGLVGILVTGAIIRTVDKTALAAEAQGQGEQKQGHGHGHGSSTESTNHDCDGQATTLGSEGGRPAWAGQGPQATEQQPFDSQGHGQGRGQGRGQAGNAGAGQANVEAWIVLTGTVQGVDSSALVVETSEGQEIVVEGRAWSFAQESGFEAQSGDQVELTGFYEDTNFEVGQIRDLSSGQSVTLRQESGRPLWAGGGRRGG